MRCRGRPGGRANAPAGECGGKDQVSRAQSPSGTTGGPAPWTSRSRVEVCSVTDEVRETRRAEAGAARPDRTPGHPARPRGDREHHPRLDGTQAGRGRFTDPAKDVPCRMPKLRTCRPRLDRVRGQARAAAPRSSRQEAEAHGQGCTRIHPGRRRRTIDGGVRRPEGAGGDEGRATRASPCDGRRRSRAVPAGSGDGPAATRTTSSSSARPPTAQEAVEKARSSCPTWC